MADM